MANEIRRVGVFCASSIGTDDRFAAATKQLGKSLLEYGYGLVYGGAHVGLMGLIADTVLNGGGEVIGVIPRQLVDKEIAHKRLSRLEIVDTMHQRKARMADMSDAFIALPGAYGTLDELFEILTWAQLGIHTKPIGILNVAGYYDNLLAFLDRCVDGGLMKAPNRTLFVVEEEAKPLLDRMEQHQPARVEKWATREGR